MSMKLKDTGGVPPIRRNDCSIERLIQLERKLLNANGDIAVYREQNMELESINKELQAKADRSDNLLQRLEELQKENLNLRARISLLDS